jgi:hypothetical protein
MVAGVDVLVDTQLVCECACELIAQAEIGGGPPWSEVLAA